jgi:hypothetical protein
LRHKLALAFLFLLAAGVAAGCVSGAPSNSYADTIPGKQLYNLSNVSHWEYSVVMSTSGANSTWNMTMNQMTEPGKERHMEIGTVGNGMDILYDVWYDTSTFQVNRMHAKGWIGDYYQERNVSTMQIQTLPDTGLLYYQVPMQFAGSVMVRDVGGQAGQLNVFTASNGRGLTLTYWTHPAIPVPVKIQLNNSEMGVILTMMLDSYK